MTIAVPAAFARIWRNTKAFLFTVFLLALIIRIGAMVITSSYRMGSSVDGFFYFGTEMGRVAQSLAQGHGFSSPMPLPTGPTAIIGPIYPLVLALIFKIFGIYTVASAVVILTIQCLIASATCYQIYLCGRDSLSASAGKIGALVWAFFPLNILFSATRIWETSLSALLAITVFRYLLQLRQSDSVVDWGKAGALLGAASLVNTSLLIIAIPFLLSAVYRFRSRFFPAAIIFGVSLVVVSSPWTIRNYVRFGKPILRSNFPLEFRVANNPWSHGQKIQEMHPATSAELNVRWAELGEARFMAELELLNKEFISTHPKQFALAILNRVVNYWTGAWIAPMPGYPNQWPVIAGISFLSLLGLSGASQMIMLRNSAGIMYAGCFALYPIVYYLTTSQPRFYHTITPMLILSGSAVVIRWFNRHVADPRDAERTTLTVGK